MLRLVELSLVGLVSPIVEALLAEEGVAEEQPHCPLDVSSDSLLSTMLVLQNTPTDMGEVKSHAGKLAPKEARTLNKEGN